MQIREKKRLSRHSRTRKKVSGTPERPRLCIHRSLKNFSAVVVDDISHKVILSMSTEAKVIKEKIKNGGNVKAAEVLGEAFAQEIVAKGVKKVSFDRGGHIYHGRVKAFAEAARKAGLEF